jgi:hypothetical protein
MAIKTLKLEKQNPLQGNLTFIQYCVPPLENGEYKITVEQHVSSKDGKINDTTYQNTKRFAVKGTRFTLDPSLISSVFPPENANGEYRNVLPHVCFTRDSLPWELSVGDLKPPSDTPNVPPWLGVLVIAEKDPECVIKTVTLRDLLSVNQKSKDGKSGLLPADYLHPVFPDNALEPWETWDDPCVVIDIPRTLFNQIAPSYEDLGWLGHVREVQAGPQSAAYLTKLQSMSDESTPPRFSTIIANRLPAEGMRNLAVLVSLENFGNYLPDKNGAPKVKDKNINMIRLVLLKQWNFYAAAQLETFSGYLLNLNADNQGQSGFLQLPTSNDGEEFDDVINNAFNMGYVPLNHLTRQGDKTVSWYRGPFLPFSEHDKIKIPVPGPDSSTAYNPDTGMLDVSYAAAFQLGRLLALQNNNFAQTLYNWKRENLQAV